MALLKRADLTRFQNYVEAGNYGPALELAEKFGLDKDDIYKPQWIASNFGAQAIREVLARVEDAEWVVAQCEKTVCPSFESMSALLSCGLRFTERYVFPENGISSLDGGAAGDKGWWFRFKRLRLLQYKDRLDTFLAINNGRYSQNDYKVFRSAPLHEVAFGFAERGKSGPLSLLFKRHTYSLAPYILQLLNAIPETLPPRTYSQLLPDGCLPKLVLPRNREDWVESEETLKAAKAGKIGSHEGDELDLEDSTEYMVKVSKGLAWPKEMEIVDWYQARAREIDKSCGLLENSLSLLDFGVLKGFRELETPFEDVSDLHGLVFSSDSVDSEVGLTLSDWEGYSKYEKFKIILNGVKEETVVDRLREQAIPFMTRHETLASPGSNARAAEDMDHDSESFLVRWLKETAKENKLPICAAILAECCREQRDSSLFNSDEELVSVVLFCIYACGRTDQWSLMSSMLARLPGREVKAKEPSTIVEDGRGRGLRKGFMKAFRGAVGGMTGDVQMTMSPLGNVDETQPWSLGTSDVPSNNLSEAFEMQVRQAEGHVEAGQLLLQYQVPRPISFFLTCKEDGNDAKQLLRILLLKFANKEQAKSDNGWALLWRDLRTLQEKAFPFLEKEYLLSELCQGILKAGKFSLAKNYLKGTGTTTLRTERAEKLVLNAAREYFYSAPDLDSSAIGKARHCLNLLPASPQLTAEINLIDAITEQLPSLGVTLLPLQFRQLKNSMEAVKMAISAQAGVDMNILEIMELAKLLGLSSPDDTAAIEAVIARESAAAGEFGLALDMCLALARKGHGPIWDLCAAMGRGPDFEEMDWDTRKELLGFALGHCDEDSVGELLSAWKEFDFLTSCDNLGRKVGKSVGSLHEKASASHLDRLDSQHDAVSSNDNVNEDLRSEGGRCAIPSSIGSNLESGESLELFPPWLLDISSGKIQDEMEFVDLRYVDWREGGQGTCKLPVECRSQSAQAAALILQALASHDVVADDKLVVRLAQESMRRPVSTEGDAVGCGYLLNLSNAHLGAELLEMELERRENYEDSHQALEWAFSFSSIQNSALSTQSPKARREKLIQTFKGRSSSNLGLSSQDTQDNSAPNFWKEFSIRAGEILRVSEESRRLRKILPGVDVGRFLSGDEAYIQERMFSHVDSLNIQQGRMLPEILILADQYKVDQWQIYERYFLALLRADWASEEEVVSEISGYSARLLTSPERLQDTIEVYDQIIHTALDGLRNEGPHAGSEKGASPVYKRTLMRALVSLSSDNASVKRESNLAGEADLSASDLLYKVRCSVWRQLCQFAEDLQVPLQTRIFILELLESIRNGKVLRQDFWRPVLLGDEDIRISWGKWEAEGGSLSSIIQRDDIREERVSGGSSINILAALKSTHIISGHWHGWEVTANDLGDPQAASSFFNNLLDGTSSLGHAKILKALLEEWEKVFGFGHWKGDEIEDVTLKEEDDKEDWGEGWEEFSENNWAVHTLHSCWKATLQKLTEWGGLREALSVLDTALLHPTSVLVTEGEAQELVAAVGEFNPSAALQLSLLLPYNPPQVHGLRLLEEKLKIVGDRSSHPLVQSNKTEGGQGGNLVTQDLTALILSSGLLSSIADDPSWNTIFSALCELLGQLALQGQELQLSMKPSLNECIVSVDNVPFCALAFPFFVGELTKSKKYGQAGALVLQVMRVHPALATWNAAYIALKRYLSSQADGASVESISGRGRHYLNKQEVLQLGHLKNTVQSLTLRLEEVLRSALKTLSNDMK
ncbi:unnamed protein product [Calypogeia fissa]